MSGVMIGLEREEETKVEARDVDYEVVLRHLPLSHSGIPFPFRKPVDDVWPIVKCE